MGLSCQPLFPQEDCLQKTSVPFHLLFFQSLCLKKKKIKNAGKKKEKQQFFNDILKVGYDSVQGHFWVHGALWQF